MTDSSGPTDAALLLHQLPFLPEFYAARAEQEGRVSHAARTALAAARGAGDVDGVAAAAAGVVAELLGGPVALALLYDGATRQVRVAAPQTLPPALRRQAGRLPARLLAQVEECLLAPDPDPVRIWPAPAPGERLARLLQPAGCTTIATVPVRNEGAPSALLVVGLPAAAALTDADRASLLDFTQQAAGALAEAHAAALRARQAARLELVGQVSAALASASDVLAAARHSASTLRGLAAVSTLLLVTADDARGLVRLAPLAPATLPPATPEQFPLTLDSIISADLTSARLTLHRGGSELEQALWDMGMRFGVRVPLVSHGQLLGAVLSLEPQRRRTTETELALLEDLARLLAPAVESYLLQERAAETQRELRHLTSSLVIANEHLHNLTQRLEAAAQEQQDFSREAVLMLATAAEAKDQITGDHLHRIQHLCVALARALRLPASLVAELGYASMLHDVGKLHVPDSILRKAGPLTADEWEVIRQHPLQGVRILGRHPAFALAREIALAHHEKWDGSGYPHGLAGESIPLTARVVAVADVFDSLVSPRPYKAAWRPDEAIAYIADQSGRHFDPAVVARLLELWERGEIHRVLAAAAARLAEQHEERQAPAAPDLRSPAAQATALARRWSSIADRVDRTLGSDSAILCFERARQRIELRHPLSAIFEEAGNAIPRLRLERLDTRQVVVADAAVREYLLELHHVLAEMVGEPVASVLLTPPDPGFGDRLSL